jgi:hypothetical protein
MSRKLWFFIAIFSLLHYTVAAQKNTEKEDVVYLKNGSIIRGNIQEQKMGESLKIELLGGSVLVFQQNEIDSIKKEDKIVVAKSKPELVMKQKGYRNITETGIIFGKGTNNNYGYYYGYNRNDFGVQLHTINGYQFNRFLFAGGGMGIERFISYRQSFAPFYLRLSSDLLKKRVTPYVFTDIGYALFWINDLGYDSYNYYNNKGGLYLQAGGGVRIFTRSKTSVHIGAAYKRVNSSSSWEYNYEGSPQYELKRAYQRVVFLVGVSF